MTAFLGMVLGSMMTLIVAHFYYKQATKDLKKEMNKLKDINDSIQKLLVSIEQVMDEVADNVYTTNKHVTYNTPDDPDYPYK